MIVLAGSAGLRRPALGTSEQPEAAKYQEDGGNRHCLVGKIVALPRWRDCVGSLGQATGGGLRGGLHGRPAFLCLAANYANG
jgi:hypothetical protein